MREDGEMPHPMHMSIKGTKQGAFKGESEMKGREHTVLVQALHHEMHVPTDRDHGQATGAIMHGPLTVTKAVGASSPQLYQALCTNEILQDVTIDFYRIDATGHEENFYRIKLKNAIIVKIEFRVPSALEKSKEGETYLEDISFRYEQITWEHLIAKTMSTHSWVSK